MTNFPETNKIAKLSIQMTWQQDFILWLISEKGVTVEGDIVELLCEFHGVDDEKAAREWRMELEGITIE